MSQLIVIGGEHHNTFGVIRSVAEKGIKPDVIIVSENKRPYIKYSCHINKFWVVERVEKIVSILVNNWNAINGVKPVIISCSDLVTSVLDVEFNVLNSKFHLPLGKRQGIINYYMNKETMRKLAEDCGLLCPISFMVDLDQGGGRLL